MTGKAWEKLSRNSEKLIGNEKPDPSATAYSGSFDL